MNKPFVICVLIPIGLILVTLIIPTPTLVLDILMVVNILFALMILIVVLNVKKITDFTLLPISLLISTFLSTAVSIAATRLILYKGAEFNGRLTSFVSLLFTGSENIFHLYIGFALIGFIFGISSIVIVKGATRVAEVAARFTLDYMQVKLMAIEALYNSGEINEDEAASQKAAIQKESDFLSSLDSAVKYLSGYVKVIILIILIIVIGGSLIDVLYRGISVNNAIFTYFSLAVGSGILFMLPPFLLSVAVRCVVTRSVNNYLRSIIS